MTPMESVHIWDLRAMRNSKWAVNYFQRSGRLQRSSVSGSSIAMMTTTFRWKKIANKSNRQFWLTYNLRAGRDYDIHYVLVKEIFFLKVLFQYESESSRNGEMVIGLQRTKQTCGDRLSEIFDDRRNFFGSQLKDEALTNRNIALNSSGI